MPAPSYYEDLIVSSHHLNCRLQVRFPHANATHRAFFPQALEYLRANLREQEIHYVRLVRITTTTCTRQHIVYGGYFLSEGTIHLGDVFVVSTAQDTSWWQTAFRAPFEPALRRLRRAANHNLRPLPNVFTRRLQAFETEAVLPSAHTRR